MPVPRTWYLDGNSAGGTAQVQFAGIPTVSHVITHIDAAVFANGTHSPMIAQIKVADATAQLSSPASLTLVIPNVQTIEIATASWDGEIVCALGAGFTVAFSGGGGGPINQYLSVAGHDV